MKIRIDVNIQNHVITFTANLPICEYPIDVVIPISKKEQKKLRRNDESGQKLVENLSKISGVSKVKISSHEVEVVLTSHCDTGTERESVKAMMVALGTALNTKPEFVIVTKGAAEEDTAPEVDPPLPEL